MRFTQTLRSLTLASLLMTTPNAAVLAQMADPAAMPTPRSQPELARPRVSPSAADSVGYTLGPGDRVKVEIFNVPEYSGEHRVLSDGTLNLPLIGTVPVQGMTLKQASEAIGNRYREFVRRPIVTVLLLEARPIIIAVAGEVNRPGSYTINPDAPTPTLTKLLQEAGGITRAADIRNIQVRRPRAINSGEPQVIQINLWQLLREGDLSQDMILRDGDSIFIPTSDTVSISDATQLASASFVADQKPIKVAIVGEVRRPGPYTLTPTEEERITTVTAAIQAAGGITETADIRNIQVRRPTREGTDQVVNLNLWQLLESGDLTQDLPLQEGDTVVIPLAEALPPEEVTKLATASFSPDEIVINIVGEVENPGPVKLPPNAPLNQALLAAGGFNNRARRGNAELIRLNPNGTVSQRSVSVDFAAGVNDDSNPPLRNNDTIVVGKSRFASASDSLGLLFAPLAPVTGLLGFLRLVGIDIGN